MTLITLESVARRHGETTVFEGVGLRIEAKERLGIVGDNGSGKTTLVRLLAGLDEPDAGKRATRRALCIAYGEQIPLMRAGTTVRDFVLRGDGTFDALEQRIRALEAELAERPHDAALLATYGGLQGAFEAGGGYHRGHTCERVLDGIGFAAADLDKDVSVLSGGEQSRLALCALMTTPADLLILDEPTNHLDLEGIEFLEGYLARWPGAVVVVSHDRTFLDNVTDGIVAVEGVGARRYRGNYSAFCKQREAEDLAQARAFKNQQEFVAKEMEFIRRNMAGRMHAQAKGRLKRLQRLERLQAPSGERTKMVVDFARGRGLAGQAVIEVEDLAARTPDGRTLFAGARFRANYGETIGVLGRNGTGKTTLLRILLGRTPPAAGSVKHAHSVRPGYFSQDLRDLPEHGTVLDALRSLDPTVTDKELRDHLALFLFRGDDVDTPVEVLSGGEKRRLALARLLRSQFDFLCLDEPTDHLDISSAEVLEAALVRYGGAAVVISHDRRFLQNVTDRLLWIENETITVFESGLQDALDAISARRLQQRADAENTKARSREPADPPAPAKAGRIRNPMLFERLEQEIIALEERLETLRNDMLDPENYQDGARMQALQQQEAELCRQLDDANARWENWA